MGYWDDIAGFRQQKDQQESQWQADELRNEWHQANDRRARAHQRYLQTRSQGDLDEFEFADGDCQSAEQRWQDLFGPDQPQTPPALADFASRNQAFLERPGSQEALQHAFAYMTRPRNETANNIMNKGMGMSQAEAMSPRGIAIAKDLLEMYGESYFGAKYDRNEESLTPTEAAKISGVSPKTYNRGANVLASQGRFSWQNEK